MVAMPPVWYVNFPSYAFISMAYDHKWQNKHSKQAHWVVIQWIKYWAAVPELFLLPYIPFPWRTCILTLFWNFPAFFPPASLLFVLTTVLIQDGSSVHVAHIWKNRSFLKKNQINDSFDVTKRLQQIEIPDFLHMRTLCSDLPSYISTKVLTENNKQR